MIRNRLFLMTMVFITILFFSIGSSVHALDNTNTENNEESSYYFIHFNGEEQNINVNDSVTLILTGWADESKSSVLGRVENRTDSTIKSKNLTIEVTDDVKELAVTESTSVFYKLAASDSFKVEIVPFSLNDQKVVTEDSSEITPVLSMESPKEVVPLEETPQNNTLSTPVTPLVVENPFVNYATHVQNIGWQTAVSNGEMAGTQGQTLRLESIRISIGNLEGLGIKYTTHVQDFGWLSYVSDGKDSGTTGKAKRLEAIKIELTGDKAVDYDIYYRVHVQDYGWMNWVKNGEIGGTTGKSKRLEAIEVKIVKKENVPPTNNEPVVQEKPATPATPSVVYTTHVQDFSWLNEVSNGTLSGTVGKSKRLEAIKINLKDVPYGGNIIYSTHVQDYGWLSDVSNGTLSGTEGKAKRLEAIKINLTGDMANYYDIYYRVHAQDYGWLGWAKNGMKAGTQGRSKRLEAIEVKLVSKGQGEAVNENSAFIRPVAVFLDPGHGGTDPGATSGGYNEANLNLSVAKKVQTLLLQRGYIVYMSRNTNTTVSLYDRPQTANELKPDIFVSIHHNAGGASGIESYYYEYDPEYPSKINSEMHNNPVRIQKSITLANLIQKNMIQNTGASNRGVDGAAYAVTRETAMPSTLLELGFIDNSRERQNLVSDSYQNKLAQAIVNGIDEYFKIY